MSDNLNEKQQQYFAFDKNFQEKIMQAMIVDQGWAMQFIEVLDIAYFEYNYLKMIADRYVGYHKKYKEFPSIELLKTILHEDLKNAKDMVLNQQVVSFLKKVIGNENLADLPYVKEKSLDFCKKQKLQNALETCVEHIVHDDYDKVAGVIREALTAGTAINPGLILNDETDIDARYSETYRKTVPTGCHELDKREILNGGLGAGELGIVVAPTGTGKSHTLVHFAAQAIKQGKNVVFYTFELNERMIGIRIDSHLTDIDSTSCFERIGEIKEHYRANNEKYGKLVVKYYPTGTCTIDMIRSHLERLSVTGFVPDMIVIDYIQIMRSSEKYEAPRFELKKIFEEMRGFCGERGIPVWSAVQSNKQGADSEIVGLENMSESYGQAHVCDFVLGLSRKPIEKATGLATLFIAKNRMGIDGIQYKIHLDTARSKFRMLKEHEIEQWNEMVEQREKASKNNEVSALRNAYKNMQKHREDHDVSLEKITKVAE